jgi:hypothetical protein
MHPEMVVEMQKALHSSLVWDTMFLAFLWAVKDNELLLLQGEAWVYRFLAACTILDLSALVLRQTIKILFDMY